ncbi:hypothetical protein [Streptomyces sp. NPDC127072]|uniref:hypothetical protein n=1 Tax=Streptomyces sp. NPDC127072 TaxID=3347129 RepID=UPI003658F4F9
MIHWKIVRSTWRGPPEALHLDQLGLESAVQRLGHGIAYESATEPTDAEAPMSASRPVYRIDTYGEPLSLC